MTRRIAGHPRRFEWTNWNFWSVCSHLKAAPVRFLQRIAIQRDNLSIRRFGKDRRLVTGWGLKIFRGGFSSSAAGRPSIILRVTSC